MNAVQEKKQTQTLRVFLSYEKSDEEDINKIQSILYKYYNLRIFTSEMLSAGEDWVTKLRDEITQCDIFMVLLSPNSIESNWVLTELGAAWGLEKLIIPIFTQPEILSKIPVELKNTQSFDIGYLEEHPEVLKPIIDHYKESILC
ncbi:MAG: toll/interleukin-1 receptor domain-containing protein [Candidatus Poribacteria bacterium]